MDGSWWIALVVGTLAALTVAVGVPVMVRDTRRRQSRGEAGGMGGMAGAFDAVWSPTAHASARERHLQHEAPAPAPSPVDKGIDGGRVVIEVPGRP